MVFHKLEQLNNALFCPSLLLHCTYIYYSAFQLKKKTKSKCMSSKYLYQNRTYECVFIAISLTLSGLYGVVAQNSAIFVHVV